MFDLGDAAPDLTAEPKAPEQLEQSDLSIEEMFQLNNREIRTPLERQIFIEEALGKKVSWRGIVGVVNPRETAKTPMIHFGPDLLSDGWAACIVNESSADKAMTLRRGWTVSVTGVIRRFSVAGPMLEDCTIEKIDKPKKKETPS